MTRPDTREIDATFLAKQLGHHRVARYFGRQANGSTRYGLSTAAIAHTPLRLPKELGAQQGAGAIMRLLDTAIAKTEAVIVKLKQVRAGLVHDLLTRGLDHNGELRDPIARRRQFEALPGGPAPKNWNRELLSEAADWYSGGTPDRSQVTWWSGDLPFLTPKDMKRFRICDTLEHITALAARAGSRIMPSETAFIVVRGMILAHTFPVCLSSRSLAFNQDIKAVRGKAGLTTRYLAHWFVGNAHRFLRKATEATHGTKKLDMGDLGRMVIAIPPPTEQNRIVKQIETANALSRSLKATVPNSFGSRQA
jgi:type I restriction enzyme S subunit